MLPKTELTAAVWLTTYWSYIEGVWAEELLRTSRQAEQAALAAEALMCFEKIHNGRPVDQGFIESLWHPLLAYQHHDVYWTSVTDMRKKGIEKNRGIVRDAAQAIHEIAHRICKPSGDTVSAINWLPEARCVEIKSEYSLGGSPAQEYKGQIFGFYDLPSFGFKSFKKTDSPAASSENQRPESIGIRDYTCHIDANGLIRSINGQGIGAKKDSGVFFGEIRCLIGDQWYDNKKAEIHYFDGPVASIISRESSLKDIPILEDYYFYKDKGYIKAEVSFDFKGDEVGIFAVDDTKINILIPTSGEGICYDIPFGYTPAKEGRAVYAVNWLRSGGIVYVNGGNVKHYVQDGVIKNPVAWGGNHFSNRMHYDWYGHTQYDLRLYGKHTLTYYIIPAGNTGPGCIAKQVQQVTTPVYLVPGSLDISRYASERDDWFVTSIYSADDEIYFRGVKLPDAERKDLPDFTIVNEKIF
jgi:hypothetical protein